LPGTLSITRGSRKEHIMKRILASMLVAGTLVAGAGTAAVVAVSPAMAGESAPAVTDEAKPPRPGAVLDEVLQSLVADGTITQVQADAITAAMHDKVAEIRDRFPGAFRRHRGLGPQVRSFLEDGVITAEELAQLPEGHPLRDPNGPAAKYLDDGKLTRDELQQMRQEFMTQHQADQAG